MSPNEYREFAVLLYRAAKAGDAISSFYISHGNTSGGEGWKEWAARMKKSADENVEKAKQLGG